MNAFDMRLLGPETVEELSGVSAFVGTDASGQFGLRARHERFLTVLEPGLVRLQRAGNWEYLAQAGAVLHFADNRLTLVTRGYLRSADFASVSQALDGRFAAADAVTREARAHLQRLEREMFRRLWQLQREAS